MGAVIDPFPRRGDPLARRDRCHMSNNGNEIAVAASLDAQNRKAVFPVVERHALNETCQHFPSRRFRLGFHAECRIMHFPSVAAPHGTSDSPNWTPARGCTHCLL